MANGEDTLPNGSSYLFYADAQAILEEAPNLNIGLALLQESYEEKDWDDKKLAADIAAEYAQELRYRFEDTTKYTEDDVKQLAPIDLTDIPETEGGSKQARISEWERLNLEYLDTDTDSANMMVKGKLKPAIEAYASKLRREENAAETTDYEDYVNFFGKLYLGDSNVVDTTARFQLGLTGGVAKLLGLEGYVKSLEESTDPSRDDEFGSALAQGGGTVAGAVAAGAVGGPAGSVAYLGLSGAGEVRDTYEDSMEATGDSGRATVAASIEFGSQALQTAVGAKVYGSTARLAARKILGKEVPALANSAAVQIGGKGLAEGTTEAFGGVVSNYADKYGTNNPELNIWKDFGTNWAVGAIFGSGAGGVDTLLRRSNPTLDADVDTATGVKSPLKKGIIGGVLNTEAMEQAANLESPISSPPTSDTEVIDSNINADFTTADGSKYGVTEDGATVRLKGTNQDIFYPFDKTFSLTKETATKLSVLENTITPDGKKVQILTDGVQPLVESAYVDENLNVTSEPTNTRLVFVPFEDRGTGTVPLEVSRPKSLNGNQPVYNWHIGKEITEVTPQVEPQTQQGGRTTGAQFTKESRIGERLRQSAGLADSIRQGFGDEEGGFLRYVPKPRAETRNASAQYIQERGVDGATIDLLDLDDGEVDASKVSAFYDLIKYYSDGVNNALAAGDTKAAEDLSALSVDLGYKVGKILTNAGQVIDIARVFKEFDPNLRILSLDQKLRKAAVSEVASEEGISSREVEASEGALTAVNEEIKKIKPPKKPSKEGVTTPEDPLSAVEQERLNELNAQKDRLEKIYKKYADRVKKKNKEFTPEQRQKMQKLLSTSQKLKDGSNQIRVLEEALDIEKTVLTGVDPSKAADTMYTLSTLSLLTDPRTQGANILGGLMETVRTPAGLTFSGNPTDAGRFLYYAIKALPKALTAAAAELEGTQTYKPTVAKYDEGGKAEFGFGSRRKDFIKTAPDWLKTTGFNNLGIIFRALSATDSFFYFTNREGVAGLLANQEARKGGADTETIRQRVADALGDSKEAYDAAFKEATQEAEVLKEVGIKTTPRGIKLRAWEILEANRPQDIRETSSRMATRATYSAPPVGTVGKVISGLTSVANAPIPIIFGNREVKPFRYQLRFLNVAGNMVNSSFDLLGRQYIIDKTGKGKNVSKSVLEQRVAFGNLILGTSTMALMYGMANEFADEKDPYFDVIGYGPTNSAERTLWKEAGGKPYSIKWGDKYYSYSYTPFVFPLGMVGAKRDIEKYNKKADSMSASAMVGAAVLGSFASFLDNSFMRPFADLGEAIINKDVDRFGQILLLDPIKSNIPFLSLQRFITQMTQDPINTENDMLAKLASGTVFASMVGEPALNVFGEPIGSTLQERAKVLSRFYSERTTDPDFRWLTENGYRITDDKTVEIPTKDKPKGKQRIENFGSYYEGVLTPDEKYRFTESAGPQIRQIVARYRQRYGISGYQKKVQEQLDKDVARVRSRVKYDLFVR